MFNNNIPFIMEDGTNTSYIIALFSAMFYKISPIQNILSLNPENSKFYYLQELIYGHIVNNMRFHYAIDSSYVNEIRNYMIMCGWKSEQNIADLYEVHELYLFLVKNFSNVPQIECKIDDQKLLMDCIEVEIDDNTSINMLVNKFVNENLKQFTFEVVPEYIPIYLNRNIDPQNNYFIDIQQGISMYKNNIDPKQKYILWDIHSIICLSKGDNKHYYTIICNGTIYYMLDDTRLPSMFKIDIKNEEMSTKIKQECVFIFYVINQQTI